MARLLRCVAQRRLIQTLPASPFKPMCCFTEEEEALRSLVKSFADKQVLPKAASMDEHECMDKDIIDGLFQNGLMGIEIERQYGGSGMSFTGAIIAVEELAKADPSVSVLCDVHNTLVNTVVRQFGSDRVKQTYLPKLAASSLGCFCLSESSSGSDAFALKTVAERDGDGYVLNGSKMWITNADHADIFLVFANCAPEEGHKGITCFLVEKDCEGLRVGKREKKLGIRASGTCTVELESVRVPSWQVVGAPGQGYKIAIEILNEGRIGIAAQMLGLARGAFHRTLPYLYQRQQFGSLIGDFQAMQHQNAEVALSIETAHLLTYNAARLKENGLPFIKEAAMAKLHASRVAEAASSRCIEWLGGIGFTREAGVEKLFRDCKIGAIYEGTSNIQLQTIAKAIAKEYK